MSGQAPVLVASAAAAAAALGTILIVRSSARGLGAYRESLRRIAEEGFADAFVFVESRMLVRWAAAASVAIGALAGFATGSLAIMLGAGIAALLLPRLAMRRLTRSRLARLKSQLPDALVALAAALRAGLGLSQAVAGMSADQPRPIALEFALIARKQRLGTSLDRAMLDLAARVPVHEFALFASAVRIAHESGGSLAATLERLADTLRRRIALEEKIDALTAQGRLQGVIVGALPLLLIVALSLLEPDAMARLWSTPPGWIALGVVAVLEVLGALLIRRIVRIEV